MGLLLQDYMTVAAVPNKNPAFVAFFHPATRPPVKAVLRRIFAGSAWKKGGRFAASPFPAPRGRARWRTLVSIGTMNIALHTHDPAVTRRVAQLLEAAGGRCQCFPTPEGVMHATHQGDFDVAVIDTRGHRDPHDTLLAWVSGHAATTTTAIVLVTADAHPDTLVRIYEAGVDDVVPTPVHPHLLAARVRAVHRRARQMTASHHRIHMAGFTLDRNTGAVHDHGRIVDLTPREFAMAWFLFSRPCSFASREAISMAVWGLQADIAEHTIEQHVYMLRKKLRLSRERGVWIRATYGRGYRLEARTPAARSPLGDMPHADALGVVRAVEAVWLRDDGLAATPPALKVVKG
jgi:DNA-binding response OmpR family regulator